jgi:NADPH2:quinone reductase
MRAVLCEDFGPPESLVVREVPDPNPGPREVVVDVHACSVSFPDTLMLRNAYQFKPPLPFSPGGEISGVVRSIGTEVASVAVGDRVLSSTGWGGLVEQIAVAADRCVPVPEGIDLVHAAAFIYAYGTSQYALSDRADLRPGEILLVLGAAGGVGLAAVELGVAMGARVIAAASDDDKLALCVEHGAEMTINYATEDLKTRVRELTAGYGADVVYDPVGGAYSEPALRAIAWGGRFLVVGFAAGDIPKLPLNLTLLKSCSVIGVFWGAFVGREPERNQRNLDALLKLWSDGTVRPHVSSIHPLEDAGAAIREVADRKAMGKVVVKVR